MIKYGAHLQAAAPLNSLMLSSPARRLTSFPILLLIHFYERFTIAEHRFPSTTAHSLYTTIPRRLRSIPFLEAIVGTESTDLYDAIFDLDVEPASSLFREPAQTQRLRSAGSRESMRSSVTGKRPERVATSRPRTPIVESPSVQEPTTPLRGRRTHLSSLVGVGGERPPQSPISKLFDRLSVNAPAATQRAVSGGLDDTIKKLEALVGDLQGSSAAGLREEMKELQVVIAAIQRIGSHIPRKQDTDAFSDRIDSYASRRCSYNSQVKREARIEHENVPVSTYGIITVSHTWEFQLSSTM